MAEQFGSIFGDTIKGSITYTAPQFSSGGAINGGFNFDLPLASAQTMNNQALAFTAANSAANRQFVGGVIATAQTNTDRAVSNQYLLANNYLSQMQTMFNLHQTKSVERIQAARPRRSGCFITTAICEQYGLPDDCDLLQTLRKFRDEQVSAEEVAEYYANAPDFVAAIRLRKDAAICFEQLSYIIFGAYGAIMCGRYVVAHKLYREAYEFAKTLAKGE